MNIIIFYFIICAFFIYFVIKITTYKRTEFVECAFAGDFDEKYLVEVPKDRNRTIYTEGEKNIDLSGYNRYIISGHSLEKEGLSDGVYIYVKDGEPINSIFNHFVVFLIDKDRIIKERSFRQDSINEERENIEKEKQLLDRIADYKMQEIHADLASKIVRDFFKNFTEAEEKLCKEDGIDENFIKEAIIEKERKEEEERIEKEKKEVKEYIWEIMDNERHYNQRINNQRINKKRIYKEQSECIIPEGGVIIRKAITVLPSKLDPHNVKQRFIKDVLEIVDDKYENIVLDDIFIKYKFASEYYKNEKHLIVTMTYKNGYKDYSFHSEKFLRGVVKYKSVN